MNRTIVLTIVAIITFIAGVYASKYYSELSEQRIIAEIKKLKS